MAAFEKKAKKNLANLVVLRKKCPFYRNWNVSARQKYIDIFTITGIP